MVKFTFDKTQETEEMVSLMKNQTKSKQAKKNLLCNEKDLSLNTSEHTHTHTNSLWWHQGGGDAGAWGSLIT